MNDQQNFLMFGFGVRELEVKEIARLSPCKRNVPDGSRHGEEGGGEVPEEARVGVGGHGVQGLWSLAQSLDFMLRAMRSRGRISFSLFILKR